MSKSSKFVPWQSSRKPAKYTLKVGDTFGRWTIIGPPEPGITDWNSAQYWLCRCECGTVQRCMASNLARGLTKGCRKHRNRQWYRTTRNLAGERVGRWTVLREDCGRTQRCRRWFCKCECGTIRSVTAYHLLNGSSLSCGCLNREVTSTRVRAHGLSHTPEYQAWSLMVRRCTDTKDRAFKNYGGRGIKVCERWLGRDGFTAFLADIGAKPTPDHSLDRRNPNGDYDPANCRWATRAEQSRNKRNNVLITHNGQTKCITDWSQETGLRVGTIRVRLQSGWSPEEALTAPVHSRRHSKVTTQS